MHSIFGILLLISVVFQGGFFPTTYLLLGIIMLLLAPFSVKKIPSLKLTIPFLVFCTIYLAAAIINGISYDGLISGVRPFIAFVFWILIHNIDDKKRLLNSVIVIGSLAAIIGLISFCGILPVQGMNIAGRLQSTFQYANAAGIFFAACALLASGSEVKRIKGSTVVLLTAMILTQSVGSISAYLIGLVICVLLSNNGQRFQIFSDLINSFFLSSIFAGLVYILSIKLELPFAALAAVILLFLISYKGQDYLDKLKKLKASAVTSAVGVIFAGILIISSRGISPLNTYVERLIQINDGINAILSNPLFGFGPGRWENIKYAWQSAEYSAGYVHSSIIQLGIDAGVFAVIAAIAACFLLIKSINKKEHYVLTAIIIILLHSIMDITMNFMGICFLLLALCYFAVDLPAKPIKNRLLKISFLLPFALIIYLFIGQIMLNNVKLLVKSNEHKNAQTALEAINHYYINSYESNYLLSELYYINQDFSKFVKQQDKLPYITADALYTRAVYLAQENRLEEAIDAAFKSIEQSLHQESGYRIAHEIILKMPEDVQGTYLDRIKEYERRASETMHPLGYVIEPDSKNQL